MTYIFISLVIEIVNIIFDANYYVPRFSKVFPRYTAFLAVKSILVAESGNIVKRSDNKAPGSSGSIGAGPQLMRPQPGELRWLQQ